MTRPTFARLRTRLSEDQRGSVLVEFALYSSFWVLMLFGIADYALFIAEAITVQNAAQTGASWGAAAGDESAGSVMTAMATTEAQGLPNFQVSETLFYTCTAGGAVVTAVTACPSGIAPMRYITVTTSATATPVLKFSGVSTMTLTGSATLRVIN
jgi:Flp pilus assembly protein TadG